MVNNIYEKLASLAGNEDVRIINACGVNIEFHETLETLENFKIETLLVDPRLSGIVEQIQTEYQPNRSILAIGAYPTINTAKLVCSVKKCGSLALIPLPLANDSICMDRCSKDHYEPSFKCRKPTDIYIIYRELRKIGIDKTLLSLGEIASTICSLKETLTYKLLVKQGEIWEAESSLATITSVLEKAVEAWERGSERFLIRILAIGLLVKCCLAYRLGSHEHVARSDHSIGKAIEIKYHLPHGEALIHACKIIINTGSIPITIREKKILEKIYSIIASSNISKNERIVEKIMRHAGQLRPPSRHPLIDKYLKQ